MGNSAAGAVTAGIASATPLAPGAGNYLELSLTAANADAGVGRAVAGSVDLSRPVTFEFSIRLDTSLSGFTSSTDYLTLHNHPSLVTASGASTWLIRLVGGSSPQWQVYNGGRNDGAFNAALLVNTGMPATAGTTYRFTVVADSATRSYSTTIDNGNTTVMVANMGFRSSASSLGSYLSAFAKKSAATDQLSYAIDSIRISGESPPSPPEPPVTFPVVFDMVHHNPGEALYQSQFNDPAFTGSMGANGKVYFLFESAQLAVNWDEFDTADKVILPQGSADRAWVDAKRAEITAKYDAAKSAGLEVYAMSDLILFPKRLVSLHGMSSTMGNVNDPNTQLWLRRLMRLMFTQFPQLDGIMVRIGETYLNDAPYHQGKIDNKNSASSTIIPLMNLLREEVCVQLGKKIYFRTWGSFDTDLATFLAVSNGVEPHANLTWSVKHCEGDFHRGNSFSKVLGQGRHPFIVEVQCAREYEGKGAYPNYIAHGVIDGFEEHAANPGQSLRHLWQSSPLMRGVWTWSRGGGWEGPYIKNELWCELNAWVMAQWARDPAASEESLFNRFATEKLGLPPSQVAAFRELAMLSAEAAWRAKRGTNNGLSAWWSRDQYYLYPTLPSNAGSRATVLADQDAAVAKFERIVQLARSLTPARPEDREFLISSSLYGLHLMRIWQAVKNLESNEGVDSLKLKSWLDRHDEAWVDYQELAASYPNSISSFYTKNALRSSGGENPTTAEPRIRNAVAALADADSNGIPDLAENVPAGRDADSDGIADFQDPDNDGDGSPDVDEIGRYWDEPIDSNGDGVPDFLDPLRRPSGQLHWRQQKFSRAWFNEEIAGESADPDGDGEINLFEFATGQDPWKATRGDVRFDQDAMSGFQFTYKRSKAAVADGVQFIVEENDTLDPLAWTPLATGAVITDDGTLQTHRTAFPQGSSSRRFCRLRIEGP